jgi:hypothetical protein
LRSESLRRRVLVSVASAALGSCVLAGGAQAQTGGATPPPDPGVPQVSAVPGKAPLLPDGSALPPAGAPIQVVNAIAAANAIRLKPYIFGGGHKNFFAKGYDCSGAVSYMLHGGGLLASPMPSGPMMKLGAPGPGGWITVYANRGHAYAVVAGLRWDTSAVGEALNRGSGPRWRTTLRRPKGYAARHFVGL